MDSVIVTPDFHGYEVAISEGVYAHQRTVLEIFETEAEAMVYAEKVRANLLDSAAESHFTAWVE